MTDIYIVGIGMTALGKFPDKSVKELTNEAVSTALTDAGATMGDVEAAWFSNTRQGMMEGQNTVRGQCALRSMGFESIPIVNVENACCSSSTGLNQAYAYLKAGMGGVALVAGSEKMFYPEKRDLMFQAFRGGWDVHTQEETEARLLALGEGLELPPEALEDTGEHSVFMDIYASLARQHMKNFGTTQRQIAAAAAKSHFHSTMNPLAQYQKDFSVDDVLNDRLISWPLTRAMCAPLSDGAGALVLASADALDRFDKSRADKSHGHSTGQRFGPRPERLRQPSRHGRRQPRLQYGRCVTRRCRCGRSSRCVRLCRNRAGRKHGLLRPWRWRRAGRKRRNQARRAHSR